MHATPRPAAAKRAFAQAPSIPGPAVRGYFNRLAAYLARHGNFNRNLCGAIVHERAS